MPSSSSVFLFVLIKPVKTSKQFFVSPEKCKNQRFEFLTPDRRYVKTVSIFYSFIFRSPQLVNAPETETLFTWIERMAHHQLSCKHFFCVRKTLVMVTLYAKMKRKCKIADFKHLE